MQENAEYMNAVTLWRRSPVNGESSPAGPQAIPRTVRRPPGGSPAVASGGTGQGGQAPVQLSGGSPPLSRALCPPPASCVRAKPFIPSRYPPVGRDHPGERRGEP